MKMQTRAGVGAITAILLGLVIGSLAYAVYAAVHTALRDTGQKGAAVATQHASGRFEVKLVAPGAPDKAEGSTLARMSIDKEYHGGLEATAKGEKLTAGTEVKGSAAYVAIERATGILNGRAGSFVLQHSGTLTRGAPEQNITVVPDSGTGQLVGLAGKLTMLIEDGKHSYEFQYTLPAAP
jgi:hypothetical protein